MSELMKPLGSNKAWILDQAGNCMRYTPCPLCNKCTLKASHLNMRCNSCEVPNCVHTEKERWMMIKRSNFTLDNPSQELITALKETESSVNKN